MRQKVIILGSTGFIGKNLVEFFAKKKIILFMEPITKQNQKKLKMPNLLNVIYLIRKKLIMY